MYQQKQNKQRRSCLLWGLCISLAIGISGEIKAQSQSQSQENKEKAIHESAVAYMPIWIEVVDEDDPLNDEIVDNGRSNWWYTGFNISFELAYQRDRAVNPLVRFLFDLENYITYGLEFGKQNKLYQMGGLFRYGRNLSYIHDDVYHISNGDVEFKDFYSLGGNFRGQFTKFKGTERLAGNLGIRVQPFFTHFTGTRLLSDEIKDYHTQIIGLESALYFEVGALYTDKIGATMNLEPFYFNINTQGRVWGIFKTSLFLKF